MKSCVLAVVCALSIQAESSQASVLLDSFEGIDDSISFPGNTNIRGFGSSEIAESRIISGTGEANWSASLVSASGGSLSYTVDLRGEPNVVNGISIYLRLRYNAVTLTGLDVHRFFGFDVDISSFIGMGEFGFSFGSIGVSRAQLFPVTDIGRLFVPFDSPGIGALELFIVPRSSDFSVTITNIAAVPEPSVAGLFALAVSGMVLRRRRSLSTFSAELI